MLTAVSVVLLMYSQWAAASKDTASMPQPKAVGSLMPSFVVMDENGRDFLFSPSQLQHPTVFVFYRGGWSAPCQKYLRKLLEAHGNLRTLGYDVVFMSADKPASLRVESEIAKLPYTVLSDSYMQAARGFGVAQLMGERDYARFKHFGVDLEQASGQLHHELAIPSVFIVDRSGMIRFARANIDPNVRVDPRELVTAASAIARAQMSAEKSKVTSS